MKKLLFIVVALFAVVSVKAQNENIAQVSLLKMNYEGVTPKYMPMGDEPMAVEPTAEGLAFTHPYTAGSPLNYRIQVTDDCLTLQKNHNYLVRLTFKVPHKKTNGDRGALSVFLSNEKSMGRKEVLVWGGDDFQVIDFEFPQFPDNIEGDGRIIIDTHYVLGTSVLKEVELYEKPVSGSPVIDGIKLLWEKNLEGTEAGVPRDAEADWYVEGTDEGIAIVNPEKKEFAGQAWLFLGADGVSMEQNHDYMVRLTMKVPSDGTYVVNMGSGEANRSCEVSVTASDDFQVIDIQFRDFLSELKDRHFDPIDGNGHIILNGGWVAGTTVVKKVEVYEVFGSGARGGDKTAINAVKAMNADGAIYNLAGQKVDASYKGIVIQNGKKRIAR